MKILITYIIKQIIDKIIILLYTGISVLNKFTVITFLPNSIFGLNIKPNKTNNIAETVTIAIAQ